MKIIINGQARISRSGRSPASPVVARSVTVFLLSAELRELVEQRVHVRPHLGVVDAAP
jgi:hypothetical protein